MSTPAIIAIAIGAVLVLAAIAFFTLARRSDVRGAGALAGEAERDPDAPPWARRLARSQRQSLYALLSLGSLISVAVRHAASSRPGLWARLRRAWVAFSQVR